MKPATQKILINIIGCLAFMSIPILSSPDFSSDLGFLKVPAFYQSFFRYFILLGIFYINYYYLIFKYYFGDKILIFILLQILFYLFITFITDFIWSNPNLKPQHLEHFRPPRDDLSLFHFLDAQTFIPFLLVNALSLLLKIKDRFNTINSEKLNAEVSYLKAQINPHFLFNTLNSLYALTLEKSNDAPSAVLKLSSIMRYVVTESAQDYVALEKELNYVTDYIALQKFRIDEATQLEIIIEGNSIGKKIAPLILIPFIENAFKYGVNPDENSFIKIKISINDNDLQLSVSNSIVIITIADDLKTETGLKNTQQRLEHIYPNKHHLTMENENNIYTINLNINLE